MAAFKDELDAAAGSRLAAEIARAWPDFPVRRFTRGLAEALEPLELLARGDELARRLGETLPASFSAAAAVLEGTLASPTFTGWIVLPCGAYVARAGIDDCDVALPLLAALTPRGSSEFAIRPFVERHPGRTYEYLHAWLTHPDEHVRRLVSEGTRPRLPWAAQLRALVADPAPNLPLLDALVTDPSPYVRRSVANHLNDISKDHPDLAIDLATGWAGRGPGAAWVVRHGLRGLVKRDDVRAMRLVGVATQASVEVRDLTVEPATIRIGEAATFTFSLQLAAGGEPEPVDVIVDYRVHYVGARGTPKPPKVFKLSRRRLRPGEAVTIRRQHAFGHVSIRRIHPGRHRIDVKVNGQVLATGWVDVVDAG